MLHADESAAGVYAERRDRDGLCAAASAVSTFFGLALEVFRHFLELEPRRIVPR
jgi:hypothetical protein